jgi:hypothetical protein
MNANELADMAENACCAYQKEIAAMLRQQQAQIRKYIQVLESIANEQVELSHDKIKWQNGDHIRWAKEALK